ncbi:MAG: ribosome maturation factor RimP [Candidatus Binatia bacterium]
MAIQDIVRQIEALAAPLVEEENIELWGVDFRQEAGRWVLRLALDREGGVTLDELTRVHRQLSDLLDAHDLVPWRYVLEVSSPGLNRPLLRPSHYQRYLGNQVRIHTRGAPHERRVFVGTLCEVTETGISLVDRDVGPKQIAWEDVLKASVAHDFPVPSGKKKGARR